MKRHRVICGSVLTRARTAGDTLQCRMIVEGDTLRATAPKCAKIVRALAGKRIALEMTGHRDNNALLNLLKCECKALSACGDVLAAYGSCHSSVMGAGAFEGKPHCGDQLMALHACITAAQPP